MLELKHITYTVSTPEGEQTILNDISIDIPDRKLIVFTGPNGGGKTTLAKVIAGLEKAGLTVQEVKEKRGWECIVCKKCK